MPLRTYTISQHPSYIDRLQVLSGSSSYIQAELHFITANSKVCVEDYQIEHWRLKVAKAINMKQVPASKQNRPAFKPFTISVKE